jgi:hypothetical protein
MDVLARVSNQCLSAATVATNGSAQTPLDATNSRPEVPVIELPSLSREALQ